MKRLSLSFVLLALVALLACKKDPPPPAPVVEASDASSPIGARVGMNGLARLDCEGILPLRGALDCPLENEPHATDALVAFSEKLTELFALHAPPPDEWWAPARTALEAAKDVDPKSLKLAERVAVQNAALHLAVSAKGDLSRDALKLVDRLAFTPTERAAVEALQSDLAAWLGPPAERTERTKTAPFLHQQVHHHTRFFRLVRTPRLRANFSELIAIDTEGTPFVTNVVGSLEIRRGEGLPAPACVALQSPTLVRCGINDGLRAVDKVDDLPQSHFFQRQGQELRCNDCHGPTGNDALIGAIDLAPLGVGQDLAFRRRVTLMRLKEVLDPLRRGDKTP